MGINAQYSSSTTLTGAPVGGSGTASSPDTSATTPPSNNAPPVGGFSLVGGAVTMLLWPDTSYAFTRVRLMPVTVPSTSVKTVYGVTLAGVVDATGLPNWTTGSITLPAQPGGRCAIFSTGNEKLIAEYS